MFPLELKLYRESVLKISQSKLANTVECDHSYISRLENGSRDPSRIFVEQLVRVTKPSPYWENRLFSTAGFIPGTVMAEGISYTYSMKLIQRVIDDTSLPLETRQAINQLVDSLADTVKLLVVNP